MNCRSEWDKGYSNQVDIECVVADFFFSTFTNYIHWSAYEMQKMFANAQCNGTKTQY